MIASRAVSALAALLAAAPAAAQERTAGAPAPAAPAGAPATPSARSSWPLPAGGKLEVPASSGAYPAKKDPPRRADPRERLVRRPGQTVNASDALDEIIDEVAADLIRLGTARVSPILLERFRVSANLDPALAGILEARLSATLTRSTDALLVRCDECEATRAEVVDAAWVVSRGITRREQAQELARRHGARSFLRATLSASTEPAEIALDVELVRAEDGAVAYAESYRFGGENAFLFRGADRAQARQQALKELEDRLNQKPYWSIAVELGMATIQAKGLGGPVSGAYGGARISERFGEDRRHRISMTGGGFNHANAAGGIFQIGVGTRLGPANVWAQTVELAVAGGAFIGGGLGNAPLFTATLDYLPGIRIGFRGRVGYLGKFRLGKKPDPLRLPSGQIIPAPDDRPTLGGYFAEGGVTFSW